MYQQQCRVGKTSSYLNTEVKQHWARTVLGWETAWELQVLLEWVWMLMMFKGFKAPLAAEKPRCPSHVEGTYTENQWGTTEPFFHWLLAILCIGLNFLIVNGIPKLRSTGLRQ